MLTEMATVPGFEEYAAAVKRENDIRDAALLDLPSNICGKVVVPMTLRHWVILHAVDSPFLQSPLARLAPMVEQVIQFLWILNPRFSPHAKKGMRTRFSNSCANVFYNDAVTAIDRFVMETFQDSPPVGEKASKSMPQVSFAVSVVARLAGSFHWSEREIFDMPLKRTFQYLKVLGMQSDAARGQKPIAWNPSDHIRIRLIRCERERRKQEKKEGRA